MGMTLEEVLDEYFGLASHGWNAAYGRMVECLTAIGGLTGHSDEAAGMVEMLDKIDSQDGEV